jgi:dUTP pyrophosphatase
MHRFWFKNCNSLTRTNHTFKAFHYLTFSFVQVENIKINIINESSFPLPAYATEGSSGMDIRANIESVLELDSMERILVPTGLFLEIPIGYEAQVRPRSGLAIKQGITCLNTPGTIDADYRGEVKVILINLSTEVQKIFPGDRIAQIVIQKVERVEWKQVEALTETVRGEGGFGHSGKQ